MDPCLNQDSQFKDCPCKAFSDIDVFCNFEELYGNYKKEGKERDLLRLVCSAARIEVYCKENNVDLCRQVENPCPCKLFYAYRFFCNFSNMYAELLFRNENRKAQILLNSVCSVVKSEILYHDFIGKVVRKYEKDFLEHSKAGQQVYCTTECDNVILLKKADEVGGKCMFKTHEGKISEQWAFCFRTISKGDRSTEYEVKGKNFKKRAKNLEILAQFNGFRVEKQRLQKSFLLKIYGDSQEELDDFVALCCNNNLVLY